MSYTFLEDIPEFLENQRTSFLRILDTGLIKALEKINPIAPTSSCNYGLLFYPKDYVLVLPDNTTTEAFLQGKTYGCKIYVPTIVYEDPSRLSSLKGKFFKTPKKGVLKNVTDDFSEEKKNRNSRPLVEQRRSATFGGTNYPEFGQQSSRDEAQSSTTLPSNLSQPLYRTSTTEKNSKRNVCFGGDFDRGRQATAPIRLSATLLKNKNIKNWINDNQNTNFGSGSLVFKPTFKNYNACYSCLITFSKHRFLLKSKQRHISLYDQKFDQQGKSLNKATSVSRNFIRSTAESSELYALTSNANMTNTNLGKIKNRTDISILPGRGLFWTKKPQMFSKSISEHMQSFKPNLRFLLKNVGCVQNSIGLSPMPVSNVLPSTSIGLSFISRDVGRHPKSVRRTRAQASPIFESSPLLYDWSSYSKKRNLILQKAQKGLDKTPIQPTSRLLTSNTDNYPFNLKHRESLSLGCYYTLSRTFLTKYNSGGLRFGINASQNPTDHLLSLTSKPPGFSCQRTGLAGAQGIWGQVTEPGQNLCDQPRAGSNTLFKKRVSRKEWVCIGVLPLMTPRGHFIINGSHRIIVSQMSRAPGLYYETGDKLEATIVPAKGAWLRINIKISENGEIKIWVRITPQRKMPYKVFFETYKYLEVLKTQKNLAKLSHKVKIGTTKGSPERNSASNFLTKERTGRIQKRKSAIGLASGLGSGVVPTMRQALGLANQLQGASQGSFGGFPRRGQSLVARALASHTDTALPSLPDLGQEGRTGSADFVLPKGSGFKNGHLGLSYIARQTQFLSLIYKSVNNKIKHFDKHYAVGLISGQINRTLLNVASYTLGSLGRKRINERLGTNETTGYLTSKDIHLIKNKLLKLLNQGSTAVDDDIDHLENRRVRTCGELLQTEIDVGLTRLKKAIEKHLDAVLTQNTAMVSKSTTSDVNNRKQFSRSREIIGQSNLLSNSGFEFFAKQQRDPLQLYSHKNTTPTARRLILGDKGFYWPARVGVDLALIGVNKFDSLGISSKLSGHSIQQKLWTRLTGIEQIEHRQTLKRKGFLQYNRTATHKTLFLPVLTFPRLGRKEKPQNNQEKTRYVNNIPKTQLLDISPSKIVGTKVFAGALREFFGSNPLSQYMDQTNPLAEITHKRRLSSLGPGGIDRASAGIAVRGIHASHYGRICPIETPEGKNAGLVNSMTMWARINREGFLETPYLKVTRGSIMSHNRLIPQWHFFPTQTETYGLNNTPLPHPASSWEDNGITKKTSNSNLSGPIQDHSLKEYKQAKPLFLSNWTSTNAVKFEAGLNTPRSKGIFDNTTSVPYSLENPKALKIVAADLQISASSFLPDIPLPTRDGAERSFGRNKRDTIDFCGVSPTQNISVATSLIPFLEHDDATRALMGSNMQRQAVPLLKPQSPLIRTGLEGKVVGESGHALQATCSGVVSKSTRTFISIDVFRPSFLPYIRNNSTEKETSAFLHSTKQWDKGGAQNVTFMEGRPPSLYSFRKTVKALPKEPKDPFYVPFQRNLGFAKALYEVAYPLLKVDEGPSRSILIKGKRSSHQAMLKFKRTRNWTSLALHLELTKGKNHLISQILFSHKNTNGSLTFTSIIKKNKVCGSFGTTNFLFNVRPIPFCSNNSKSLKITRHRQIHNLQPYLRSNQATICVQRPAVSEGYWVQKGDLVADCSASRNGVLALGQNLVVAYLPMEGFNFEDAIVVSDRLVQEELYTSIHVQRVEFDMDAYIKKYIPPKIKIKKHKSAYKTLQQDWITRHNPHLLKSEKKNLNSLGIIKVGAWVGPGDVLVSKVFPVERKIAPSRHLLLAVFQEKKNKTLDTDDTSLRVPKGIHGRVINVKIVGNGTIRPVLSHTGTPVSHHLLQNIPTNTTEKFTKKLRRPPKMTGPLEDTQVNFAPERTRPVVQTSRSYFSPCGKKFPEFSFVQKRSVEGTNTFLGRQNTNVDRGNNSFLSLASTSPTKLGSYETRPTLRRTGTIVKSHLGLPMNELQDQSAYLQSPMWSLRSKAQAKNVEEQSKNRAGAFGFLLRRKTILKTNEQKTWALTWLKGLNFLKIFKYSQIAERVDFGCPSWLPTVESGGGLEAYSPSAPYSANFTYLPTLGKARHVKTRKGKERKDAKQAGFYIDGFTVVRGDPHSKTTSTQQQFNADLPNVLCSFQPQKVGVSRDYDLCVGAAFMMLGPTDYLSQKKTLGSAVSSAGLMTTSVLNNGLPRPLRATEGIKVDRRKRSDQSVPCMTINNRVGPLSTYSLHNLTSFPLLETGENFIGSLKYNLQTVQSTTNNKPSVSDIYRSSFELFNQPDHSTGLFYRGISGSSVSDTNYTFIDEKQSHNYKHQSTSQGTYVTSTGSSNQKDLSRNIFSKKKWLEKPNLVGEYKVVQVRVYIAERKKLQVGDKMSGRHGNKGIVSTILPREDMPYLPDGTSIDMVLNPLGIPSRMNVGQVFECLLGLAASICGEKIGHTPFDEMYGPEASRSLVYLFLYVARLRARADWLFQPNFPGKTVLFDGRTGIPFEQRVTAGRAYMLKLVHMVDEKIHARSIGPRSLVTQQPIKGRARGGGQRLGEMELWAFEGFGAAYTLQEILTLKSDDIKGREEVENSIISARSAVSHLPETFKMMLFELKGLCLNVELNQNS